MLARLPDAMTRQTHYPAEVRDKLNSLIREFETAGGSSRLDSLKMPWRSMWFKATLLHATRDLANHAKMQSTFMLTAR